MKVQQTTAGAQPPLLNVVSSGRPAVSVWRQEAEAMRDIGVLVRKRALSLPSGSALRDRLLDEAEGWLLQAQMRGVEPGSAVSA